MITQFWTIASQQACSVITQALLLNGVTGLLLTHTSLQWRHDGHDGVSNHQPYDCLLNRLFGCGSKKTSKLRVTGLCAGNSPVTGEFPAQSASNAENVTIWWRHHDWCWVKMDTIFQTAFSNLFSRMNIIAFLFLITRGQFWPSGIVVACVCVCVCMCVCLCVRQSRVCPRDNSSTV